MDEDTSSQSEKKSELSWWKQRSDLEKALLISVSVATMVVLIAGILLYTSIRSTGEATKHCNTPGCLTTASEIINNLDTTIDPCQDFFKFTCGKMIERTHRDVKAAPITPFREQTKSIIKEILMHPINHDDHQSIKGEKVLFQACMDETAAENESLDVFNRILQELNGWPVVVATSWNENLFDWTDMMIKLRQRGYIYSTLIDISITYEKKFIVRVGSPFIPQIEDENKKLYKQYMVDAAVMLGAKQRRAEEDMQKVLDFMEKLEEISMKILIDDRQSRRPSQTLEDFQMYKYEIDWLDLINGIVGADNKIFLTDQVVFPKYELLEEFLDLINATPKRIQANYMIWRVVESVIYLLSKEFRELQKNYYHFSKEKLPWENRFEVCVELISRYRTRYPCCRCIGLSSAISYARKYLPEEKRQQAQELFTSVKSTFVELLEETVWLDDENKHNTLMKADNLTELIGFRGDYFDDAIFQTQFNNKLANLEGQPFLSIYLNGTVASEDAIFSLLHLKPDNCFDYNLMLFTNPMYTFDGNLKVLLFPVRFLELSFNPDRPAYTNYGSFGFAIGSHLAAAFSDTGSFYDKDGKKNSIWSHETRKNYEEREKCIMNNGESLDTGNAKNEANNVIVRHGYYDIVDEITGIKISYSAYRKWVDENGEDLDLMGIDYTPNQLFWISAMLHRCSTFEEHDLRDIFDNYQVKTFKTTAFVRYNADFATDFNCAANSEINKMYLLTCS